MGECAIVAARKKKSGKTRKQKSERRTRRGEFLSPYRPSETYLQKPGRAKGIPGIIEGLSADGNPVLIRVWVRGVNIDDSDLVDIWRNELRVLHRLSGCAGAEEYIGRLIDAGQDDRGFYIVIAAGQRRPLATFLDANRRGTEWLRSKASPARRRQLWANLKRLALGLDLLHSQGLLHCNLDEWSVLTSGDDDHDFQLTGFEWSIRLVGVSKNIHANNEAVSFLDDWAAYANLCAKLLNVRSDRVADMQIASHSVAEHTSAEEIAFLRELAKPGPLTQVDGDFAVKRIDRIMSFLDAAAAADEAQYFLILGLGRESELSRAVREASDLSIEIDDVESQREFIRGDLGSEPRVISVQAAGARRIFLRGQELVYSIRQYRIAQSQTLSWEFAACENATPAVFWSASVEASSPVPNSAISIMTFSEAGSRVPRLRGRCLNWQMVIDELTGQSPIQLNKEERTRRSLALLHALDLVFASAEVFPVIAWPEDSTGEDTEPRVRLELADDPERNALSQTLGLRSMSVRLQELLERDAVTDDEGWLFTEAHGLGRRTPADIELQYEAIDSSNDTPQFIFRIASQAPHVRVAEGLLIPGEFRGRIAQFQRRARSLRGLREHTELLRTLGDPRSRLAATHETVEHDSFLAEMDEAKQRALEELTATLPLYLLQGPPGVGKTYLVREVVRRRFADEPTARLLLTAQSHHSVDHLVSELQKDWQAQSGPRPLAVRCAASDLQDSQVSLALSTQTRNLSVQLEQSELAHRLSPQLLTKLRSVVFAAANDLGAQRAEIRPLEGLVMRAANVVFATTNSADLERLVDERGQFDWTIIEESGKATGIELLMPLMLSHRRLMIGDHKQLPPFGTDKVDALLNDPPTLREALRFGLELVERSLRDVVDDELAELIDSEDMEKEFGLLCADAKRMLFLFQSLIEDEVNRQGRPGARLPNIARVLDIQHRMHPAIAGLVSRCFYRGAITTGSKAQERFESEPSPITSQDLSKLPDAPIVLIDMPYIQSQIGGREFEQLPRFTNQAEVDAVKNVVKLLQPNGASKRPSLAVLSPYARQVARIRAEIKEDDDCLAALTAFTAVGRGGEWCSTVDAFQGNEADAIVVSLVRNNHHATLRRALGFVGDPRRMNVLLSRARWRLYIVGSLDFLRTVASPLGLEEQPEAAFLREFFAGLSDRFADKTAIRITPNDLAGGRGK